MKCCCVLRNAHATEEPTIRALSLLTIFMFFDKYYGVCCCTHNSSSTYKTLPCTVEKNHPKKHKLFSWFFSMQRACSTTLIVKSVLVFFCKTMISREGLSIIERSQQLSKSDTFWLCIVTFCFKKKNYTTIIIIFFSLLYEKSKSQKSAYCTVVTCWIYLQNVAKKQQVSHSRAFSFQTKS